MRGFYNSILFIGVAGGLQWKHTPESCLGFRDIGLTGMLLATPNTSVLAGLGV